MELVSISELARRRSVSKTTLARHIRNGLLPDTLFVPQEGKRPPLIKFEEAQKILDVMLDAGRVQEHAAKKVGKTRPSKTQKTKPASKGERGVSVNEPEKKNVKAGKTDDKPEKDATNSNPHEDKRKQVMLEGLQLDEASGLYLADDVEIEEVEGKRIVTAKDILLSNAERYQKHRALTEALKAEQLQMKLDQDRGKLVDGDELKKKIFKVGTETRDALQNIPEQFGPDLLACQDLVELQSMLSKAINKALENLKRLK